MHVTLVRHATPKVSATVDPARWPLTRGGRTAARSLRHRLSADVGLWVASNELKALETLQCLAPGRRLSQDARFDEVRRDEPFDDDFVSRRRAWVEGKLDARHQGWETPQEAVERFEDAITAYAVPRLVIGSHGMIITAWLVHRGQVPSGSAAGRFWEALALPDIVDVQLSR